MKKFFPIFALIGLFMLSANAETLQGGVSLDSLPQGIYGSWAVSSIQTYTNNPAINAPLGIDYWNIYRSNNVLTLENPITNAQASVTVNAVRDNTVTFTRTAQKENEEVIESPTITIAGEDFWGTDKMVMKKYKNGVLIKTDVVEFTIRGKKTGGKPIAEILN